MLHLGFPGSSAGKESIRSAGDPVQFLGWEAPLEKGYSLLFLGFPVAQLVKNTPAMRETWV